MGTAHAVSTRRGKNRIPLIPRMDYQTINSIWSWVVWLRFFSLDVYPYLMKLIGQQLLWAEQSSPSNLDSQVWPRAASSAELFWSGPGGDVRTALPRLHEVGFRFVRRGVDAIALQPEWCALRPNACDVDAWSKIIDSVLIYLQQKNYFESVDI